jgi:hypothetical protein
MSNCKELAKNIMIVQFMYWHFTCSFDIVSFNLFYSKLLFRTNVISLASIHQGVLKNVTCYACTQVWGVGITKRKKAAMKNAETDRYGPDVFVSFKILIMTLHFLLCMNWLSIR